jgi:superfamily II DNA or RNA helicase
MRWHIMPSTLTKWDINLFMIDLNIKWGEPYQMAGDTQLWRRESLIPTEYRTAFFMYWKSKSNNLKEKGYGVYKKDNEWYITETKTTKSQFKEFSSEKKKVITEDVVLKPHTMKYSDGLRPWQVDSVAKLCSVIKKWGCGIDGSDVGVGKTYVACGVARELDMDILIVCPKAVMESWRRVIVNHFKMHGRLVGIINYEMLRMGRSDSMIASYVKNRKTHVEEFKWKIPKSTLIVWDESQKLKGATTKNSEVCLKALKDGYKMLFCSATNATNPLELRTVGMAIKLFENNKQYYQWLYAHGVSKGRFGLQFNGNKEVLKKLHKDIFVNRGSRLTRDTIPNFPESQIIAECYDMEEEAQRKINSIYDEMENELAKLQKKIKKEKNDSAHELTAILRARQKVELVKVPLFVEMIEEALENNMSVVVFVNFTETIEALSKRLNTTCIVNGVVSDTERQKNIDDFQSDKQRVILVNIAAGGAGLSLHDLHGNHPRTALISPSYSAVLMRQATGRVWRDSAKSKSLQKIVFVAKTVEERVCKTVNEKLKNMDLLNDGDLKYEKE